MSYYYYTILTGIVILTSLSAIPFLAWGQTGTTAESSRMHSMKTTTTENIYESQLGYRLQYPLGWILTEYPTSMFASALVNGGNAVDIALCPEANISLLEEEEDDDSLKCMASTDDKVWVWIYMPVDDDIPSLAATVKEDNGTKKPFIVQGASNTRVLDEFINATLASLAEVYEQTNLSIINQTSIMVNVTGRSDVNESTAATATKQKLKQQLQLPAKIVEYVLTEPETFGDGTNDFRRVALFIVDYEENRAFEIEYMPMSATVPGYPEEVGKIFKSFEIIRNNNNTASLQNYNNTQAEISDSFTAHQ
jgi:hypothetical protein